ncbi:potassium channel family protein [Mycobacterium sp.]|uniref:potassium channel family protein n=1 Tax=Mycobacterium sp. TaxID=1785 RepID=UPI000CAA793F|nr:potassium channel family protein [Mycobacterium sp.]PJE01326.1 MAG: hypothetical protein CK428_31440 [Mycobacterium sp.]
MSSEDQEKSARRWISELRGQVVNRRHALLSFGVMAVLAYAATSPWRSVVDGQPRSLGTYFLFNAFVGLAIAVVYVWALLASKFFRSLSAPVVLAFVIFQVIFAEGIFAEWYFALSVASPGAFEPRLTGIDAIYFTISTATSTGMGDIHPASHEARLVVSAQMITSLYLTVIAVGTAAQRVLVRDRSDFQVS